MTEKRYLCTRCGMGLNNDQITHHGGLCCFCSAEATAAAEQRLTEALQAVWDVGDELDSNHTRFTAGRIADRFGVTIRAHNDFSEPPRNRNEEERARLEAEIDRLTALLLDTPPPASPRQGEPVERVEVRNNPDGTVDEVLFYVGDRCVFHLEQMDTGRWWFALYPNDGDWEGAHFDVGSTRRVWVADRSDSMTYPAAMRSPAALSEPAEAGEPA